MFIFNKNIEVNILLYNINIILKRLVLVYLSIKAKHWDATFRRMLEVQTLKSFEFIKPKFCTELTKYDHNKSHHWDFE